MTEIESRSRFSAESVDSQPEVAPQSRLAFSEDSPSFEPDVDSPSSWHPSLATMATSPLIRARTLYRWRSISVLAHLVVIITGLATRPKRFFFQYTNLTNMLSFTYTVVAFSVSVRFHKPSETPLIKNYYRAKPSRLAWWCRETLGVTTTMHFLTTLVFWPLVFPHAIMLHGTIDLVYFTAAHGVTLFCILVEVLVTRATFNRHSHTVLVCITLCYSCVGFLVFFVTGWPIYPFFDLTNLFNLVYLPGMVAATALLFEASRGLTLVRDWAIARLLLTHRRGQDIYTGDPSLLLTRSSRRYSMGGRAKVKPICK
eukprot:gnl/Dysnectes_brevis/2497_a2987_1726.p1 GENE.gnl/Dysnectes_brevis/2497_a2987_1726~~gnl/Dysnectes_brevis/2497_a2987_1726.p1  ORF type:complete len:313 (+),score=60.78 gnl/Dysnectes_brevis/2497_a2987_1726:70-1008(+)